MTRLYTDAPVAYDLPTTRQVGIFGVLKMDSGMREVRIVEADHYGSQIMQASRTSYTYTMHPEKFASLVMFTPYDDTVCEKCGGSGGGDDPVLRCNRCNGTGRMSQPTETNP